MWEAPLLVFAEIFYWKLAWLLSWDKRIFTCDCSMVKLVIPCSTLPLNKIIYEVKFLRLSPLRTDMHFMFEFIFTKAIIGTIPINCWGWLVQKLDKTFTLSSFSENIEKSIHTGLKRSISLLPLLCHLTQYFGWSCRMK